MKTSTKVKKEIKKFFKELLKKYPLIDSLSSDINVHLDDKEFVFVPTVQADI